MTKDFQQQTWDAACIDDCRHLVRLAVREDLDRFHDWTTLALVPGDVRGEAEIVARKPGVIAGLQAAGVVFAEMNAAVTCEKFVEDGAAVVAGQAVARIGGVVRDMLTCERITLNFIGRLSGIATLTRQYVQAVAETNARIYDTRKTTPGWRRLEKFAVRCGGGRNHRLGLFDAVLIKDNHLACHGPDGATWSPAAAVRRTREFLREAATGRDDMLVEIEVDNLAQFQEVLPAGPDIVLLDNMSLDDLRRAVARRDAAAKVGFAIELEASGGVNLESVRDIASTGVDRISVGALTHSAICFDVGLDWRR